MLVAPLHSRTPICYQINCMPIGGVSHVTFAINHFAQLLVCGHAWLNNYSVHLAMLRYTHSGELE